MSDGSRTSDTSPAPPSPASVVYRTDAHGVITHVGDGWDAFAAAAGCPTATSTHVVGRRLESFIADPTTRMLYRAVADRVRSTAVPAQFPFRCDAPGERRAMLMEISSLDDGGLEYRTSLQLSEARAPAPVTGGPRDGRPMLMCGWCKRVEHERWWVEVEEALVLERTVEEDTPPLISHGICPSCEVEMNALIDSGAV